MTVAAWPLNLYSNGTTDVRINSDAISASADATIPLHDRLRLSGGLRSTRESQEVDASYIGDGYPGSVADFDQNAGM